MARPTLADGQVPVILTELGTCPPSFLPFAGKPVKSSFSLSIASSGWRTAVFPRRWRASPGLKAVASRDGVPKDAGGGGVGFRVSAKGCGDRLPRKHAELPVEIVDDGAGAVAIGLACESAKTVHCGYDVVSASANLVMAACLSRDGERIRPSGLLTVPSGTRISASEVRFP